MELEKLISACHRFIMVDENLDTSPLNDSIRLSQRLSQLLDDEFELLSKKDLEAVEQFQDRKLDLMQSILGAREKLGQLPQSEGTIAILENVQTLLATCKDKHLRNDLLLKKQIEITKGLLNVITQRSQDQSSVYDKLGRLK